MNRLSAILPVLFVLCAVHSAQAREPKSVDQLPGWFAGELVRLEQITGGNPDEWQKLESQALQKLESFATNAPESLAAPNKIGRTPLSTAAAHGLAFLVRALVKYETVKSTLDLADKHGFTAADRAQMARGQSLFACHPQAMQHVFVSVPHLLRQPYYQHRDPYPEISAMLREHKLVADVDRVRNYWLGVCKNATPEVREAVKAVDDFQAALIWLDRKFLQDRNSGLPFRK